MVPSPWERMSFLRGMCQGGAVAREMSSGNLVRVGQWGATSRTCSSSSLSLHSVCASRLTGGNAYLRKARGQLCASASVPRGPSVREKYSWQWEDSGEANRSTWASPNRLQISQIVSGWNRHSPGNKSCRESALAARLSCPGMRTARSDLNCVWLQLWQQYPETLVLGAPPARRKARSIQGLRERRHCWVIPTRSVPRHHAHLGTRECNQCWSDLIWSNPSGVTAAADAICPRSLWNCFSGTTFLPLKELRQFSTAWAHSYVRRANILTESNSCDRPSALWIRLG